MNGLDNNDFFYDRKNFNFFNIDYKLNKFF